MSTICQQVHWLFSGLPKLGFPLDKGRIPLDGIYILFEEGELAHGVHRVVRIGTHTGAHQLPSRLEQHFVKENKDRSIFRKNIGRAILNRDNDPFLEQWEVDRTPNELKRRHLHTIDLHRIAETEKRVSDYIQRNFHLVVFRVEDKAERLFWESRLISTVSLCEECRPSETWLGRHSPKEKIRRSGLWLVNELYKQPLSSEEYECLQRVVLEHAKTT